MPIAITKITQFSGHKEALYTLVYAKKAKKLYSAGGDGYIVEWNFEESGDGKAIANAESTVYNMVLSPDEKTLYAILRNGELIAINLQNNSMTNNKKISEFALFSICLNRDSIYVGNEKGTLYDLDLNFEEKNKKNFGSKSIRSIVQDERGMYLGTSEYDIYHIDKKLNTLSQILGAHENSVFTLCLSANFLWSGGRDAYLKSWQDGQQIHSIPAHNLHINSIDYNPETGQLITASMDKSVKIWDANTGELLKVIDRSKCDFHLSSVNKVLWIGKNTFTSCADDRKVIVTEIEEKQ